jgi:hypothetical protein
LAGFEVLASFDLIEVGPTFGLRPALPPDGAGVFSPLFYPLVISLRNAAQIFRVPIDACVELD